jgi:hypothetical protein
MTALKAQINMPLPGWIHENMAADERGYKNLLSIALELATAKVKVRFSLSTPQRGSRGTN